MELKDIKIRLARYRMSDMKILTKGMDPFTIRPDAISSILLEKDYDREIFPYFEVQCIVPSWFFFAMQKNSSDIHVTIDFQYGLFNKDIEAGVPLVSDLRGKFYAVIESSPIDATEEQQTKVAQSNNQYRKETYGVGDAVSVTMALYNEGFYKSVSTQVNAVLSSATLMDAMTYTLNQAGISNILVSPPDNRSSYREFKITPIKASSQIKRICNEYGFHKDGSIIFFDLDRGYIVSRKPDCTAWVPNEYKTTHLMSLPQWNQASVSGQGCYSNSKEKYNLILMNANSIIPSDTSAITQNTIGNNFNVIDSSTGKVTNVSSAAGKSSKPAATYVYDSGSNTGSLIQKQLNEAQNTITVGLSNCVLSTLSPNKQFIVGIDDPKFAKYSNKYRISRYTCIFDNEGEYWSPHVSAVLKR